ncbi:TetR/AcrR family transcriptional regulator [Clostridium sp.]|uniref:TetR/AcrR family transcriptional regulator n=1 Tax=Clostridium sp. TaxID=1506 RepID=UPI00260E271C
MPKIIKNVKEDLLTEGKKQLLSNGYLNLNIRNITKKCNIGTGTFYNYFKNKEQLVIDILCNDWTYILNISNQIIEENISFKEKIIIIYNNINDFLKNYRLIFSEMANHTSKNHYIIDPMYETLEKLIDIHIKKGEINPSISSDKFAYFLLNNLILISHSELTIDDLFLLLNI